MNLLRAWVLGLVACCTVAVAFTAGVTQAQVGATDLERAPTNTAERRSFYLAQHDVLALGTHENTFVNASFGARVDYAVTPSLRIGMELAYANLEGQAGRAHSVLGLLQFEGRAAIDQHWSVPVRIALGHLASNGAVLRLASGIALKLTSRIELVLEVAPTLFSTEDGVYPAVGPGLELNVAL